MLPASNIEQNLMVWFENVHSTNDFIAVCGSEAVGKVYKSEQTVCWSKINNQYNQ